MIVIIYVQQQWRHHLTARVKASDELLEHAQHKHKQTDSQLQTLRLTVCKYTIISTNY